MMQRYSKYISHSPERKHEAQYSAILKRDIFCPPQKVPRKSFNMSLLCFGVYRFQELEHFLASFRLLFLGDSAFSRTNIIHNYSFSFIVYHWINAAT